MSANALTRAAAAAASLIALSAAGGCSTLPSERSELPTGPSAADRHTISVAETGERLDVPVGADDMTLSHAARNDLVDFARSYARWGHGSLVMSMPSGGGNSDAAARLAQQARIVLADSGVPYLAISGTMYDASGRGDAPILLNFIRFEAQGPECEPLWSQDLARPEGGTGAYESFGCATVSNLAALLEDPHDYLEPRGEEARDAARRAFVLGRYREGQQTHATRTTDERVSISGVIQ